MNCIPAALRAAVHCLMEPSHHAAALETPASLSAGSDWQNFSADLPLDLLHALPPQSHHTQSGLML